MGRQFNFCGFLDVLVLHLAIASTITTASYARIISGWISIDCGSNRESYNDSVTSLAWENDKQYTTTGSNAELKISQQDDALARYPNAEALQTFRYFPEHHNKYCYVLPTPNKNVSVLIRAMFYPGALDPNSLRTDKQKLPIEFEVAVNATIWFSVRYDQRQMQTNPLVFEGIFYSPGGTINVCLLPKAGVPFISSLELRPLDDEGRMYRFQDNKQKYLVTKSRIRFADESSVVRFPDDNFDRFWDGSEGSVYGQYYGFGPNSSFVSSGKEGFRGMPGAELNYVPSKVMQDAIQYHNYEYPDNSDYLIAELTPESYSTSSAQDASLVNSAYVVLYFQDLQSISAPSKTLNMSVTFYNADKERNFSVTNNVTMQTFTSLVLESSYLEMFFTTPTDPTALPFINAMEIYAEEFFDPTATFYEDAYGIKLLQEIFKFNQTGDPCSPRSFDWLQCDNYGAVVQVTSVVLSEVDGDLGTLSINNLYFNISYFPLLSALYNISISHGNVGDELFEFIILALVANGNWLPLRILDFSHNNIQNFPTQRALGIEDSPASFAMNMDILNLSHNALTGGIPLFLTDLDLDYPTYITSLDLSYNNLSSFPVSWKNATALHLEVVNFSNNIISSNISLLSELIQTNNSTLKKLDVSHNKLQGYFPGSVYFSKLDNLEIAKFDGNQIDGTLNLTTWYKSLEEAEQSIKSNSKHLNLSSILRQLALFSFINNSISDITPHAEMIYSTVDYLLNNIDSSISLSLKNSGILLGGNPYCRNTNSHAQRYLCRNSLREVVRDKKPVSTMVKIFVSLGGAAVFFMCCAIVVIITRLKKKILGLQKIQQALAYQKVIPLFYSLSEIKTATRRFHDDNLLGKGAFGVVYKGILADRSSIAVKKLFKSEADQIQVLNDFLNEVVLISGIKHKHLVHLKGCCVENQERILVYEYAENGNVAEALWGNRIHGVLDWETRLKICVGIAQGLQYLHEHLQPRIIHRDIKPANILLDKDFNPKIADFGLARSFPDDASQARTAHHGGTWGYLAPDHEITEKVDVYSFGIVVLEIVSGRKIIESDSFPPEERYLRTWAQRLYKEGTLLKLLQPELRQNWSDMEFEVIRIINVALLCVDLEPYRRPPMSQVVTMLLGSMDAPAPCTVDSFSNLDFDSLLDNDPSRTMPTIKTLKGKLSKLYSGSKAKAGDENRNVEEQSLLRSRNDSSGTNSNHNGSSGTNSNNIIEMSNLSGR